CIGATGPTNGSPVILNDCLPTSPDVTTSWVVPKGKGVAGQLQIFGSKCIDVKDGVNADGTELQIWDCTAGNTNQLWIPIGTDDQIQWAGTDKCIDLTDGNLTHGTTMQIWTCDVGLCSTFCVAHMY
ncbi:ricin B lectin domain-containing protein, partial [Roridomyces roridus]